MSSLIFLEDKILCEIFLDGCNLYFKIQFT